MKALLLILCTIITNEIFSQTFKVSDVQFSGDILSKENIQKKRLKALDCKVKLTIYDNSVKITIYDKDDEENVEEYILDKTGKVNEYCANLEEEKMILELKTWINYITSATVKTNSKKNLGGYTTYEQCCIVTLKRD